MSIKEREWTNKDGSVTRVWVSGYNDANGKWKTKQFNKKKDAQAHQESVKTDVRKGIHIADSEGITIEQACRVWLDKSEAEAVEGSTLRQYKGHVNNHIVPAKLNDGKVILGKVLTTKLTKGLVASFRDQLLRENSRATAKKVFTSFRSVLAEARLRGSMAHDPAEKIEINERQRDHADQMVNRAFMQPSDIKAVIAAAREIGTEKPRHHNRMMVVLCKVLPFTGLSAGEFRGLYWENVDFVGHRILVRTRADEKNAIGKLKAGMRYREIPMTPEVEQALREWREICPRDPRTGELKLVFPRGNGRVEAHNVFLDRGFHPLQIRAGIVVPRLDDNGETLIDEAGNPVMVGKYIGLHDFRHFFASWLIKFMKADPKLVQTYMGHSTIRMTYDIYGHLFQMTNADHSAFAKAAEKVLAEAAD
jgi:integrase